MTLTKIHIIMQKTLRGLLIFLMAAMAIDVLWQIATRFLLGDPSVWTEELARFILIWLGCLGAAFGVGEGFHLEMDYFLQKAGLKCRQFLDRVILGVVAIIACVVFIFGGIRLLYIAHDLGQTSAALGIPMAWVYLVIPVSGILMVVSCIYRIQHPLPAAQTSSTVD